MPHLTISVDRDRCLAAGQCTFLAPQTFDIDDEMKVVVLDGGDTDDAVRAAAEACPNHVITVSTTEDRPS
jgi:ferredoxin